MPEPDDLRSIIAAAADAFDDDVTPPAEEAAEPEAAQDAPATEAEEPKSEARGPARGPDGKFAKTEAAEAEETEETAADTAASGDDTKAAPETLKQGGEAAAVPVIEAPQHWSAADRQKFAGIPAEHRGLFLDLYKRMEAGFTPKLQRGAQLERDWAPVEQLFAPHQEALRQRGTTPAALINAWASVEQSLLAHKAAVAQGQPAGDQGAAIVANIIRGYGVNPADVARLLQNPQAAPQPYQVPPAIVEKLDRLERAEQMRAQQAQQARLDGAQRQIDAFAAAKDANGNLTHPFFAEVEADIAALAQLDQQMGKEPDLNDLYDRAVFANRTTRDKLLAQQRDAEAKRAAAERKAKSEAAQKAAVSVTGSPEAGQAMASRSGPRSLRDTISDALAEYETA